MVDKIDKDRWFIDGMSHRVEMIELVESSDVKAGANPLDDPQVRRLLYGQGGPFGPKKGLKAFKTVIKEGS